MLRICRRVAAVTSALLAISCGVAAGATDFVIDPGTFVPPTGDVIATQERTITLDYSINLPEGATVLDPNVFDTTFRAQVLRDLSTQRLTFVYQVDPPPQGGELSLKEGNVIVSSFAGFLADVSAPGHWFGSISDQGTITAETTGISGSMLNFVVASDATDFDSNGTAEFFFQNVFAIENPTEPSQDQAMLGASVKLNDVFQPAVDTGGGGGGGAAIPLPASAWTGLLGLAIVAAAAARANARGALRLI